MLKNVNILNYLVLNFIFTWKTNQLYGIKGNEKEIIQIQSKSNYFPFDEQYDDVLTRKKTAEPLN